MNQHSIKWESLVKKRLSVLARSLENEGMQREYFMTALGIDFGFRNKKVIDWMEYLDADEVDEFRQIVEDKLDKEPRALLDVAERSYQACKAAEKVAERIAAHDTWDGAPRSELAATIGEFMQVMLELTPVLYLLPVDEIIERRLKKYLHESLSGLNKTNLVDEYFLILTQPERPIAVVRDHLELVRVCADMATDEAFLTDLEAMDAESLPPGLRRTLQSLVDEYGWINTDDFEGQPWTLQDYLNRVRFLMHQDCRKELSRIEGMRRERRLQHDRIFNELQPEGAFLDMIRTAAEYSYLRTYRAETWIRALYQASRLLGEVARRMHLEPNDIRFITLEEITSFLESAQVVPKNEIRGRRQGFDYVMVDAEVTYYWYRGTPVDVVSREQEPDLMTRIEGTIASMGVVKGRVKVVDNVRELTKVEEGDILVASMTTPEFIPAMERAKGFVTDEGGLTCHAAIVSRELGVPCIVGTGTATKVLRDGDFVELNANEGYVVKLAPVGD